MGFNILETFFPGLKIVSCIFGLAGKLVLKFSPAAKQFAGVVSNNVYKTLKMTVKGLGEVLDKLKNHPIEQELIQNFPDNYTFNKKEVIKLLDDYSIKIESLIKKEMDNTQDDTAKAIIQVAKSEVGLKQPVVPGLRLI